MVSESEEEVRNQHGQGSTVKSSRDNRLSTGL